MTEINHKILVEIGDLNSESVKHLIDELSDHLHGVTGRDGRDSFSNTEINSPKSVFLVSYLDGHIVECGALRMYNEKTCELKRMYTRKKKHGVGKAILKSLEQYAIQFSYSSIILETGIQNNQAINFYKRNGYETTENFGKYIGRSECICFKKTLKKGGISVPNEGIDIVKSSYWEFIVLETKLTLYIWQTIGNVVNAYVMGESTR